MREITDIKWPLEFMELKRIEDLMLCSICYEYLNTSVITPCSHNYCSLCIRKYLHYKTECPTCFKQTYEKDLRTNRILDELIKSYLTIRDKLSQCIHGVEKGTVVKTSPDIKPIRPARTNHVIKMPTRVTESTPRKNIISKLTQTENDISNEIQSETNFTSYEKFEAISEKVLQPIKKISSPSTSYADQKISSFFTSPSSKPIPNAVKMVSCPVCKVDVSEKFINKHLDDCLKRQSSCSKTVKDNSSKRNPLPKLVLSLMKEPELRKRLKEHGLSTQGDRKTLESRYHRYTIMYNAECDKTNPRPVTELIKQCENDEIQEKKLHRMNEMGIKLQVNRNSSQNVIEKEQKKYRETNKSNFQNLIQDIHKRRKTPEKVNTESSSTFLLNITEDDQASKKSVSQNPIQDIQKCLNFDTESSPLLNGAENNDQTSNKSVFQSPIKNVLKNHNFSIESSPVSANSIRKDDQTSVMSADSDDGRFFVIDDTFNDSDSSSYCPLQRYVSDLCVGRLNVGVSGSESSSPEKKKSSFKEIPLSVALSPQSLTNETHNENISLVKNIYDQTTDSDSSDLDEDMFASPPRGVRSINKKLKLSEKSVNAKDTIDFFQNVTDLSKIKQEDFIIQSVQIEQCHDASYDISHSVSTANESFSVHRPLRKRNRSMQNCEETLVPEQTDTPKKVLHECHNTNVESSPVADGVLKRRRGRPKKITNSPNHENENLPKRPLRKVRLTNSEPSNESIKN